MVKSPANGGVKPPTPKQLLQAILTDCMQLRPPKGKTSELSPQARGTKFEKLVQTSVMGTCVRLGIPLNVVNKAKAPVHHPALLAINSVFGGKSKSEFNAILNDPRRLRLSSEYACALTMVIQPFAKTQGCVDFILIMGRRIIPISVKSWNGSGGIKNNSAPIHAGVIYICISNNEKHSNLIYHGSMLGEEELSRQHLITAVLHECSNNANENSPSELGIIAHSHRPSRDVRPKPLKERLLSLVPSNDDPGKVLSMIARSATTGAWPALDIAAATTQEKQDALRRSMNNENSGLVPPTAWHETELSVSSGPSLALSCLSPDIRKAWQPDIADVGVFFKYQPASATRH